jgi:hypothetical protein
MREASDLSGNGLTKLLLLTMAVLFASLSAIAQTRTSGAIAGVVTDPSGAVVPNATVTATEINTGTVRSTKTTGSGNYNLGDLIPGNYRVKVEAPGFETSELGPVQVPVTVSVTLNVRLKVGQASQTVTVSETVPLIETQNPNTTTTLTAAAIANLPNPGQDLTYLANVAPGAIMNSTGGYGNTEFNGLPSGSNFFTQDGTPVNDPFLNLNNSGATNLMLGLNSEQEVSVNTNSFDASQGGLGAMQMSYISKQGTNNFHGNLYEIWNGAALNSADYFVNATPGATKPGSNLNQYGGSIGGPIKKDKLFFFTDIEGTRIALPVFNEVTVPTAAYQSYILGTTLPQGGVDTVLGGTLPAEPGEIPFYQHMLSLYGTPSGTPEPALGCPLGPGSVVSSGPPDGNGCLLKRGSSTGADTNDFLWTTRFDQTINARNTIWYRFQYENGFQATYTDPFNSAFNAVSHQPQTSASIGFTHTFGPDLVNEFNPGYQWYSAIFEPPSLAKATSLLPITYQPSGLSTIGGEDFVWPQGRNVTQYFANDNLSWTKGKNEFTFGEQFHRFLVSDHDFGFYNTPLMLTADLPEFAFGATDFTLQNFATTLDEPIGLAGIDLYAQDTMKATSKLTLTLGIRSTWNSNILNQQALFAGFKGTDSFYQVTHSINQPLNQVIDPREAYGIGQTPLLMWQPRFALAYRVATDTVIRGGFGVFTDIFPASLSDQLAENSPNYNAFDGGLFGPVGGVGIAPGVPDSAFDAAVEANQAFRSGFASGVLSCGAVNAPTNCLPAPGMTAARPYVTYPYSLQWNFGIEHQFGPSWGLNVYYVGTRYVQSPYFQQADAYETYCAGCFSQYPYGAAPDPRFGYVNQLMVGADSSYNALQTTVRKVMSHGLMFSANYTWSHCLDFLSNGGFFGFGGGAQGNITSPFPNDLSRDYGNCDMDVRNSLNANYVYSLPNLAHNWMSHIVNGWQVSGDLYLHTGFPITPFGYNPGNIVSNNNGVLGPNFADTVPGETYNGAYTHGPIQGVTQAGQVQFLNPYAFQSVIDPSTGACFGGNSPATCQFGNVARNSLFGPGFLWTDLFVSKYIQLSEKLKLRIDGQFYNMLNHPNFNFPGTSFGIPSEPGTLTGVGTISSLVSPPTGLLGSFLGGDSAVRMIAFQARLEF